MLPKFYQNCFQSQLSSAGMMTLQILIFLLQSHKTVQIEKLAALFPLPIKYESRRRHLQRFLILPSLKARLLWFPVVKKIIRSHVQKKKSVFLVIDRTQWRERNLFMVSLVWDKRSLPVYWRLLSKKGSSNFLEQKALLKPVFALLKGKKIILLGDREFGHIRLADWLESKGISYVLRTKSDKYIQAQGEDYQLISSLPLSRGKAFYLPSLNLTQQKGFGQVNLVGYWSKQSGEDEGWYLITNLRSIEAVIKAYRTRMGIEAMFKDCKTGGYNLARCQAGDERLESLVLLIAIAYSCAFFRGRTLKHLGLQSYVCRLTELSRISRRHSTFWVGLYGQLWVVSWDFCQPFIRELMRLNLNKLPFYQQGLRAMKLILSTF